MKRERQSAMRRSAVFLLYILMLTTVFFSQEIIENPKKPLSKDAGRILKVQEELRIIDTGAAFYFKQPSKLQVDDDGCIYIADDLQFLKFSPEGKFLNNLFKQGQGPGEIQRSFSYGLEPDKICVHDSMSRKIILMDKTGNLLKEIHLREKGALRYIGVADGKAIFSRFSMPKQKDMTGKLVDMENQLITISLEDKTEREIAVVTTKWWFTQRSGVATDPFTIILSSDGKSLYINNTQEYTINILNIETGTVVKTFRREYKRIKAKKSYYPERDYEFDIGNLFDCENTLWVLTSTSDETKGPLFDVFDQSGTYIDSFNLGVSGSLMTTHGNSFFVKETDEEGTISIVKYKIL
jgi:hypothetical protein